MTIIPNDLRELSRERCERWHPPTDDDWTLGDWGNAFGGEAGELQNAVKKLRRIQSGASQAYNTPTNTRQALADVAEEAADVLLYFDLLMWKCGLSESDILEALQSKFNAVSRAQGWDDLQWRKLG